MESGSLLNKLQLDYEEVSVHYCMKSMKKLIKSFEKKKTK